MKDALSIEPMTEEQNHRISAAIAREQSRLRNFIRKQVVDESDAEDILQDVFYELVQAYRLMRPVEQAGAGCSGSPGIASRTFSASEGPSHCGTTQ